LYSVAVTTVTAPGTWITDTSSIWNLANNWSGNVIATGAGQTANFSTINITGNRFVTLNSPRTIGTLRFSDTSGSQTWTLTASGGSQLTLDTTSATSPALIVTNTATISAPIAGTNGFTKSGPGTLILSGNNGLSGTVNIDTSSTTLSDGITRITGAGALANVSRIQIRNNNGGSSTFQLDGSARQHHHQRAGHRHLSEQHRRDHSKSRGHQHLQRRRPCWSRRQHAHHPVGFRHDRLYRHEPFHWRSDRRRARITSRARDIITSSDRCSIPPTARPSLC
jgi:autotransporter-associated beta strand protein